MLKSLSLRAKLPLSILTVILLTLSIATAFILRTAGSVISYVKSSRIEESSRTIGNNLSMQLQRAGKDMVLAAGLPNVLEGVELPPGADGSPAKASLVNLLDRVKMAYGYYETFALINDKGELLAGVSDGSRPRLNGGNSGWLNEALTQNTFVVGEPFASSISGDMLIPVSLKVVYNGKAAVLTGTLQLAKTTRGFLREASRPGVRPLVVTGSGRIVSSLDKNAIGSRLYSEKDWFFATIRNNVSGSFAVTLDGEMKTVGFYHVPQTDLYTVVVADAGYMASYLATIRTATLAAGLCTAILAVGFVCFFIFPVTRDIKRLSLFARQIAKGEQGAVTHVQRADELGDLAESLTRMVGTLQEMLSRSESATKAKSEFLARMSHEIRTPMNGIIGMTYLAMREKPDPKQSKFLQRIDAAAKSLLGLINDILDFSKMEANKMALSNESFSLSEMLRSVYSIIQVQSREKGLSLDFATDGDVPDIVRGDSLRLSQICINICSNAVKFTDQGSVSLHVSLREKSGDSVLLLFAVTDTGAGISKEDQKDIFSSFSQADGSMTRRYQGTGLGLAISKSLAEMMGGSIWVESSPGNGSVFSFTVRLGLGEAAELESEAGLEESPLPPLRILAAEDNAINQEIILEVLSGMGVTVTMAQNGAEAVALWEKENGGFDIVLMDIQMPVMDGLTAARRIRESGADGSPEVPIIAMTAHAMSGDREKSLEAGMNDHITKPLDVARLRETLLRWSGRKKPGSEVLS